MVRQAVNEANALLSGSTTVEGREMYFDMTRRICPRDKAHLGILNVVYPVDSCDCFTCATQKWMIMSRREKTNNMAPFLETWTQGELENGRHPKTNELRSMILSTSIQHVLSLT